MSNLKHRLDRLPPRIIHAWNCPKCGRHVPGHVYTIPDQPCSQHPPMPRLRPNDIIALRGGYPSPDDPSR